MEEVFLFGNKLDIRSCDMVHVVPLRKLLFLPNDYYQNDGDPSYYNHYNLVVESLTYPKNLLDY